jgi:hypothetical protein
MKIGKEGLLPAAPTSAPIPTSTRSPRQKIRNQKNIILGISTEELTRMQQEFLEDDYPIAFRPHRYPDLVDDARSI